MSINPIKRLLIANRGEIAVRIIRAARKLGIETVAVYSETDANAQHVKLADIAVCIGPAPAAQSYLSIENILNAMSTSGANAVHPGYGFLSENADFASAVTDAGYIFVGPSAEVIRKMGDKRAARHIAADAGVPVVPGYDGDDTDDAILLEHANRIGTPLMIKATAGGGGRGLRRIDEMSEFHEALMSARREAGAAFGNSAVMLERMIEKARHVEVQILADNHGNVLHLFERDCSAQRRHQKVIEEAPCSTISEETRQGLLDAAVSLAKSVGYTGAGTVEFLVDEAGAFYFLEMNTRLQVEHPVTEMITGFDLVEGQLTVAEGKKLPFRQSDIAITGHAIEARLYAEDPSDGFLPQTGTLGIFDLGETATGEAKVCANVCANVRRECGVIEGDIVSPFYDPMLAKLIAFGDTRESAIDRLSALIRESRIAGVTTNKAYLNQILCSEEFRSGKTRTHSLDSAEPAPKMPARKQAMLAAALLEADALKTCPLPSLAAWRTNADAHDRFILEAQGQRYTIDVLPERTANGWDIIVALDKETKQTVCIEGNTYRLVGKKQRFAHYRHNTHQYFDIGDHHIAVQDVTHAPATSSNKDGNGLLKAPMDGQVVAVAVENGAVVKAGDLVCVIEAMKMEHHIRADIGGTISGIEIKVGDQVKSRAPIGTITSDTTTSGKESS